MINALLVIGLLLILLVLLGISLNNKLVRLENRRENAFADIDVQLKQRHDLIPQLVSSVKGYMDHESTVLTRITAARSKAVGATGVNDKISAESELGAAMSAFNIQVEAYPDLKASENFQQLQAEVADMENKLSAVRRFFNSATRELNDAIETFPSNLFAKRRNMSTQPMFEITSNEREVMEKAPELKF